MTMYSMEVSKYTENLFINSKDTWLINYFNYKIFCGIISQNSNFSNEINIGPGHGLFPQQYISLQTSAVIFRSYWLKFTIKKPQ